MHTKTPDGRDTQIDGSTTIVCLCGSASQKIDFEAAGYRETMAGKIVLPLIVYSTSDGISLTSEQKMLLGVLHYQKMDMAHEILAILKPDPTGKLKPKKRLGDGARNELKYAKEHNKTINYYDPDLQQ